MSFGLEKGSVWRFFLNNEGEAVDKNNLQNPKNKPHYYLILSHIEYNSRAENVNVLGVCLSTNIDQPYAVSFDADDVENYTQIHEQVKKTRVLTDKVCRLNSCNFARNDTRAYMKVTKSGYIKVVKGICKFMLENSGATMEDLIKP